MTFGVAFVFDLFLSVFQVEKGLPKLPNEIKTYSG